MSGFWRLRRRIRHRIERRHFAFELESLQAVGLAANARAHPHEIAMLAQHPVAPYFNSNAADSVVEVERGKARHAAIEDERTPLVIGALEHGNLRRPARRRWALWRSAHIGRGRAPVRLD